MKSTLNTRMTRKQTAEALAKAHYSVEPNLLRVVVLEPVDETNETAPIALLEVVDGTIERGIEPVSFAADPARGVDYPSMIVEVSPREYEDIRNQTLDMRCHGWKLGQEVHADKRGA